MKRKPVKALALIGIALVMVAAGVSSLLHVPEKDASEMRRALERHLELERGTNLWPKEMLALKALPEKHRQEATKTLHEELLKVTTEDYAKKVLARKEDEVVFCEQQNERITDCGVKILAVEGFERFGQDSANIIAIIWGGSKFGRFDPETGKITSLFEADATAVYRYPMRKVGNKWKVDGMWQLVKGVPLDDDSGRYGPPAPEEAAEYFKNMKPNWEEQVRSGFPLP